MPINTNKKNDDYKVVVKRVSDFRDQYKFIALDIEVNGVMIYGCTYRDSKKGSFVSFPSHQGKDGKYYSYAYFKITDEVLKTIEKQIEDMLE